MRSIAGRRNRYTGGRGPAGALIVLVLACAMAAFATAAPAATGDCKDQDLVLNANNAKQIRGAVRCLMNKERTKRGLVALTADKDLRVAGENYSRLMVKEHFFAHVSPGGSTVSSRVKRTAYLKHAAKWLLGENLGFGGGADATAHQLIVAWMASAVHRAHILGTEFRDVGVGIAQGLPQRGAGGGATFSVEFGHRVLR
jgi:uncharacterized protein YkwD